jgi:RNA polymerase sigma-70 factor, ECF subfamily
MARGPDDPYLREPMSLVVNVSRPELAREQAVVARARADAVMFGRLYDEYLPRIYRFVACRVTDRSAAEEITATAFRRALESVKGETLETQAVGGFLFRVAASAVVDHARRKRRTVPRGVRSADFDRDTNHRRSAETTSDEIAARTFSAAMDRAVLRRAVHRLPDAQRRVIVLRYLDGLPVDEQCAAMGWTRQTFARRLHSALRELHESLAAEASDAA